MEVYEINELVVDLNKAIQEVNQEATIMAKEALRLIDLSDKLILEFEKLDLSLYGKNIIPLTSAMRNNRQPIDHSRKRGW